jgi:hypothetical protein
MATNTKVGLGIESVFQIPSFLPSFCSYNTTKTLPIYIKDKLPEQP